MSERHPETLKLQESEHIRFVACGWSPLLQGICGGARRPGLLRYMSGVSARLDDRGPSMETVTARQLRPGDHALPLQQTAFSPSPGRPIAPSLPLTLAGQTATQAEQPGLTPAASAVTGHRYVSSCAIYCPGDPRELVRQGDRHLQKRLLRAQPEKPRIAARCFRSQQYRRAPFTSSRRRYRSRRLLIPPTRGLPPSNADAGSSRCDAPHTRDDNLIACLAGHVTGS